MKNFTKEEAIGTLRTIIDELNELSGSSPFSTEHTRWLIKTKSFFNNIFGTNTHYLKSINAIKWTFTGQRIVSIYEMEEIDMGQAKYDSFQFKKSIKFIKGVLLAALDELKNSKIEEVYDGKNTSDEASMILKIINILERKLRKIIRNSPTTEKEIQDSVENLLIASDIIYKREFPSISYSSKKYIPDFSFSKQSLVLEIKFCNRQTREKELIAEINDDIMAYKQDFSNLLFLIYDIGFIRDVNLFASEFEKDESVLLRIIKH